MTYFEGEIGDGKDVAGAVSLFAQLYTRWSGSDPTLIDRAAATTGTFGFAAQSKDSALLTYLAPGAYTAVVESADGTNGIALVEVYAVPDPL